MGLIAVDTTFLIDLQKDATRTRAAIRSVLTKYAESEFCVSITVLGEFAAGFENLNQAGFLAVRQRFRLLEHDEEVAMHYRKIFRDLKERGLLIGANDMWIAASALRHGTPLVTRNADEYLRVPGLQVVTY